MTHALSATNVGRLVQLAWSHVLLAFDFDGTLAPIVRERAEAAMRPATRSLFARVCDIYPCAVISGRSRADVARRLGGATPEYIVGNHGMEPGADVDGFRALVARAQASLEAQLEGRPGIEFENKRLSLSVHYRKARDRRLALGQITEAVERLPERVRTIGGKSVVNILPAAAPHKGDALVRLRAMAGADTALFVGDDLTDEDIFALDQPGRLMTIRIGASRTSAAAFFLRNQGEIDRLLGLLVECRRREARR